MTYSAKFSQEKKFYVYQYLRYRKSIFGDIGTPYYVGKGYGRRAFSKQRTVKLPKDKNLIQFLTENMNEADAFQLEMLLIHLYGRIDLTTGCLRNRSAGGEGGDPSDESRRKNSAWHTGRPNTLEQKKKISKSMTGVAKTLEHRTNIAKARTGTTLTVKTRKKKSIAITGRKWIKNDVTLVTKQIDPKDFPKYSELGFVWGRFKLKH